jgi:TolA-binding protein
MMKLACSLMVCGAAALAAGGCAGLFRPTPQSVREYRHGEQLFRQGHYEHATVAFRNWLGDYRDESDVLRPWVMYRLGECYRITGKTERAVAVYRTLVDLHAKSGDAAVQELVALTRLRLRDVSGPGAADPDGAPR